MPRLDEAIPLIRAAGPDPGGPPAGVSRALDPFAAMAAALLARQVAPSIAAEAVAALDDQGLLTPARLHDAAIPEIQDALRGRVRSISPRTLAPLKALARWLVEAHDGRVEAIGDRSSEDLREELARVRGVGPVGADAILLTALGRPAYPVDRGTYRILVRHGWLDGSETYDDARDLLVHQAGSDPTVLREVSAGLEDLADRFCRASGPRCDACPLRPTLPEGGPLGPQD